MTPDIRYRSLTQIGLQIRRWQIKGRPCKAMTVSQAFIFHFKCYSILHFAVCQLLCWAFLLLILPMLCWLYWAVLAWRVHVEQFWHGVSMLSSSGMACQCWTVMAWRQGMLVLAMLCLLAMLNSSGMACSCWTVLAWRVHVEQFWHGVSMLDSYGMACPCWTVMAWRVHVEQFWHGGRVC